MERAGEWDVGEECGDVCLFLANHLRVPDVEARFLANNLRAQYTFEPVIGQ